MCRLAQIHIQNTQNSPKILSIKRRLNIKRRKEKINPTWNRLYFGFSFNLTPTFYAGVVSCDKTFFFIGRVSLSRSCLGWRKKNNKLWKFRKIFLLPRIYGKMYEWFFFFLGIFFFSTRMLNASRLVKTKILHSPQNERTKNNRIELLDRKLRVINVFKPIQLIFKSNSRHFMETHSIEVRVELYFFFVSFLSSLSKAQTV